MFMELVAKPMPNAMDDSTPKNLAANCSSSSWMSRFPAKTQFPLSLQRSGSIVITELLVNEIYPEVAQTCLNNYVPPSH